MIRRAQIKFLNFCQIPFVYIYIYLYSKNSMKIDGDFVDPAICDISVRGPFLYVAPDLLGWARSQLGKVLVEKRLWIREMWVSYSGSSRSRKYFHSWRGFSWPWNQTLYLTQLFPFILVPLYQSVMWTERRELFLIFGLKSDSVTFLYLDWNQTQLSFFFLGVYFFIWTDRCTNQSY